MNEERLIEAIKKVKGINCRAMDELEEIIVRIENTLPKVIEREFVCYFYLVPMDINLGINIDYMAPSITIHLPFGHAKIGWHATWDLPKNNRYEYFGRISKLWRGYEEARREE